MLHRQIDTVTSHGGSTIRSGGEKLHILLSLQAGCHWGGEQTDDEELEVLHVQGWLLLCPQADFVALRVSGASPRRPVPGPAQSEILPQCGRQGETLSSGSFTWGPHRPLQGEHGGTSRHVCTEHTWTVDRDQHLQQPLRTYTAVLWAGNSSSISFRVFYFLGSELLEKTVVLAVWVPYLQC